MPGATPGLATGVRPGRGRAGARTGISGQFTGTPRPSAAWSSFGGQWRLVRIGPASFMRMHPAFWLVLAAWLALMAYVSSLLPGPAGLLVPAGLAVGAAAAAVGGARGLAARLARPAEASFQAQVIARWVEHTGTNDDDSYISCIAVDDGKRSWSFDVSGEAFAQLALGDTVAVRASPRSGKLLGLMPDQGGRAAPPGRIRTRRAAPPGRAGPGWRAVDEGPPAAARREPARATTAGEPQRPTGEPAAAQPVSPRRPAAGEPAAAASEPEAAASEPGAARRRRPPPVTGAGAVPPGGRWARHDGGAAAPPPGAC